MLILYLLGYQLLCASVNGYPKYITRLPNSGVINNYFPALGHLQTTIRSGGANNAFGLMFAKQGHQWTKQLCMQDSDSDGHTN
eukprot:Pgem_evm1s8827